MNTPSSSSSAPDSADGDPSADSSPAADSSATTAGSRTADSSQPKARSFNARLGMTLFVIYLALYVGFVLINAFSADTMERVVFAGLNLAIVYGFALIVIALLLAGIYGFLCRGGSAADLEAASGNRGEEAAS